MDIPQDILELIGKYLEGTATASEKRRLSDWYHATDEAKVELHSTDPYAEEHIEERLRQRLSVSMEKMSSPAMRNTDDRADLYRGRRTRIFSAIRVAAMVTLVLSLATYFYFKGRPQKNPSGPSRNVSQGKTDIHPGGNKAILMLANGSTIMLDSAQDGTVSRQGAAQVIKSGNGRLSYQVSGSATDPESSNAYNTMSTPRGGQYQLVLSDGSKIWLNAASSVRYPTTFGDSGRRIEITGEAYFEIAPCFSKKTGKKIPFIVKIKTASGENSEVEVLGTHFNISAYDDDELTRVTLLEGSVKIKKGKSASLLKPGQYAAVHREDNRIDVADDPEAESAVAWKDGRFEFSSTSDIRGIMRKIARWYDVQVVYGDHVPNKVFGGAIPRQADVADVLKMLEMTGSIHFKIEGRSVTVLK